MSDADGHSKDPSSGKTESRIDTAASSSHDFDATLDTAGTRDFGASGADYTVLEPRFIGHYQLVKKLGEGGMGQVWLATQHAPLRRQVALKLIKAGMYDDLHLHRFQSERQSLAIMDHPSIAKVFDAGATPEGQPYFVMEYVQGLSITTYCDLHRLKIRERLELFIKVCEGVQHAHQKAIIHRDLKPANILVVEVDGKPMPRIIDFGLAKATTPHAITETTLTQDRVLLGTPAYMSPEQADPGVQDIDTRCDVYSLGVVLYELLTGSLPFDLKQWQKQPLYEVLRQMREQDPPRPSTKVKTQKESSSAAAEMRGTAPKQLASLLHGDLDSITMKALEKDRARRYGTPSEFASDVGRYLQNQPVMARPASTGYRLEKYARRHRVGAAAAVGFMILLTGFVVAQAVELRRITQERDRATRERDRSNRVTEFMTNMFKVSDPSETRGNSITAREILDKASKDIDPGLARDPQLQAQMMQDMGRVYDNLGLYSRAESLLTRAAEVSGRVLGPQHPDTLEALSLLGWALQAEGHYSEAEKMLRETIEIQRRVLGPEHPSTIGSMNRLAGTLSNEGRNAEAEKLHREMLDIQRRVLGPEHPDTLRTASSLANDIHREGHYPEAEKLLRETLDIQRRVLGPEYPDTLHTMQNLGWTLHLEGHYPEAEKILREEVDIERRALGPENRKTLLSMSSLGGTLQYEGHYAEAEKLQRETLEIQRRVLGPEHPDTLQSMNDLGATLVAEGHYSEAEKMLRETLEIQRRVFGPRYPITTEGIYNLGCLAARRGNRTEALSLLRQALDQGLYPSAALGMEKDPDLKSLHGDPRFDALVAEAKKRAAAAQKPD